MIIFYFKIHAQIPCLENKWFPFQHSKTGIIVDVWPPLPAITQKPCHDVINETSYLHLETYVLILDHEVFSRFSARAAARSLWSKLCIPETKTFFARNQWEEFTAPPPRPYRWETSKQCAHSMGKMMIQSRLTEHWKQGKSWTVWTNHINTADICTANVRLYCS